MMRTSKQTSVICPQRHPVDRRLEQGHQTHVTTRWVTTVKKTPRKITSISIAVHSNISYAWPRMKTCPPVIHQQRGALNACHPPKKLHLWAVSKINKKYNSRSQSYKPSSRLSSTQFPTMEIKLPRLPLAQQCHKLSIYCSRPITY